MTMKMPARPRAAALAALALLVAACGGSDGGDAGGAPAVPAPPAPRQASGPSPIAAGCTGGAVSGTAYVNAEVEPWVAADPANPSRLLAAWQQDRWSNGGARGLVTAFSDDGGATWTRTLQPLSRCGGAASGSAGDFERTSDPWVDIGPDGVGYVMGLVFTGAALAPGSSNGMAFSRSADGGRTWSAPLLIARDGEAAFNDKNTLTADATAPGFVYAVWDRIERSGGGPTVLARSADGGRTWDPVRTIFTPVPPGGSGTSQTIGNRIVVLAGGPERGALINVFTQIDTVGGTASARVGLIRSLDKGQTWGAPIYVAEHRTVGTRDATSGAAVRDGNILPAVAGGPNGELWVAWQDARFTAGATHDAIVIAGSTDGGRTWSAARAINRVPGAAAFTPTVHVRADGTVGVTHFDLRNDTASPATLPANAWLLTSRDGGSTWSEAAIGGTFDLAFAPNAGGLFIGDYQGLVSAGNTFTPLVVTTNPDTANRTDVHAPRLEVVAAADASSVAARLQMQKLGPLEHTQLAAAHHATIVRVLERRIPGWSRWAGANPPSPEGATPPRR